MQYFNSLVVVTSVAFVLDIYVQGNAMKLKTLVNRRGCKPNQEYLLLLLGLPLIFSVFQYPAFCLSTDLVFFCANMKRRGLALSFIVECSHLMLYSFYCINFLDSRLHKMQ